MKTVLDEMTTKQLQEQLADTKTHAMNLVQFQIDGQGLEELAYTAFTIYTSAGFASEMLVEITYFEKNGKGKKTSLAIGSFRVVSVGLSLLNSRVIFRIEKLGN